jgi:hypothetical protein
VVLNLVSCQQNLLATQAATETLSDELVTPTVNQLAVVETGRFKYFADDGSEDFAEFWLEVKATSYQVPEDGDIEKKMQWGVPDGTTVEDWDDQGNIVKRVVHDDRVIAAVLTAVLNECEWPLVQESVLIRKRDVVQEMDRGKW